MLRSRGVIGEVDLDIGFVGVAERRFRDPGQEIRGAFAISRRGGGVRMRRLLLNESNEARDVVSGGRSGVNVDLRGGANALVAGKFQ